MFFAPRMIIKRTFGPQNDPQALTLSPCGSILYPLCLYDKGLLTSLSTVTCPSLYGVGILKWHTRDEAAQPR